MVKSYCLSMNYIQWLGWKKRGFHGCRKHAKAALARGELRCIGATTLDEYRKLVEKDKALERRFQPVYVEEPTVEQTIGILRGIKEKV